MRVICISGKAGHGKDTVALMLREELERRKQKVLVTHYADLLKYICTSLFGWDGKKDAFGRHLLQRVGTDIVRAKQPDFWVNFIISILRLFPDEWDFVLIPDARFPNEIERVREAGFDVMHLRVERPGYAGVLADEQKKHPSETALDASVPDIRLINSGELSDLAYSVHQFCETIL